MNETLHALNRFGLGARPGEPGRMRDPRAWLEEQLGGGPLLQQDPAEADRRAVAARLDEGIRAGTGQRELRD